MKLFQNRIMPALPQFRLAVATLILALLFAVAPAILSANAAVRIQEVRSESGVTAWLVEDYSVPIVAMRFAFRGGSVQDPDGKEGLTNLMSGLFDEGAGDLDRAAFQERLDDSGAEISFSAGRDEVFGSMRAIDEDLPEAFALLATAVQSPRFDEEPTERIRAQILAGIEARSRDPEAMSEIAWAEALYGTHPYAKREEGTLETVRALTRDDLVAHHKALFARDNLFVAVVGAIDAETLKTRLDEVFAPLPAKAELRSIPEADLRLDQELRVDYDLPQTSIRLAYPGVKRNEPEFFAAFLMNEVLGGGATFSSRLFTEVREKRGLTYGVNSGLIGREYSAGLVIGTSTRADRAEETLDIIRAEVRKMAQEGPTEDELAAAKRYTIGAYAINNLDSSGSIAGTLLQLQLQDLGIDYIERRESLIEAVTLDEVKAEARKLLSAEPAVMMVGPPAAEGAPAPAPSALPAEPQSGN